MTNLQVIQAFRDGATHGKSGDGNLYIDGDLLRNYNTTLAQRVDCGFIVNDSKYSRTTSKIQTIIRRELNIVETLNGLNFGVRDLIAFAGKSDFDLTTLETELLNFVN